MGRLLFNNPVDSLGTGFGAGLREVDGAFDGTCESADDTFTEPYGGTGDQTSGYRSGQCGSRKTSGGRKSDLGSISAIGGVKRCSGGENGACRSEA